MSSPRRARSASVARTCARRFFSRITRWDFCGFDHKFGSEACFSISVSCGRTFSAPKILPEFAHFLAQFFVLLFEFLIHEDASAFVGYEAREQRSNRNYRTHVSEPVPVAAIERGYGSERIRRDQYRPLLARNLRSDSPPWIDRGRNSCIRSAQQPAIILDRAHASLIQMLSVGPAIAVPAIIRNID